MYIKDIKQSGRRGSAIHECLIELPVGLRDDIEQNVDFLILDSKSYIKYDIGQKGELLRTLIVINNADDLSNSALFGLITHLFALYSIGYDRNLAPRGKCWLMTDLYSDEVAKSWGFKNEIEDLRKIRQQKLPDEVQYPSIVIDHSVPNKRFNTDIQLVLNEHGIPLPGKERVWYVDRFSMLCSLHNLRKIGTKSLHIFTDKYTKQGLNKIIKHYSV